jgi:hypothetical protein
MFNILSESIDGDLGVAWPAGWALATDCERVVRRRFGTVRVQSSTLP